MDFVSKPAIDITTLALDGLSARHKVLASNVANADTPGYKRSDVNFEGQLSKIINNVNMQQREKEDYSAGLTYYPNSIPESTQSETSDNLIDNDGDKSVSYEDFQPETVQTNEANTNPNGNNISVEHEMAELTQNGMRYTALTVLQGKMLKELQDVIRGAGS